MIISAKFDGFCKVCRKEIRVGDRVQYEKGQKGVACVGCKVTNSTPSAAQRPTPQRLQPAAAGMDRIEEGNRILAECCQDQGY